MRVLLSRRFFAASIRPDRALEMQASLIKMQGLDVPEYATLTRGIGLAADCEQTSGGIFPYGMTPEVIVDQGTATNSWSWTHEGSRLVANQVDAPSATETWAEFADLSKKYDLQDQDLRFFEKFGGPWPGVELH